MASARVVTGLPHIELTRTEALELRSAVAVDGSGARALLVTDRATGTSLLIDPSDDGDRVLEPPFDAGDDAGDPDAPLPQLAGIVLTRRRHEAAETVERVRRRTGAPLMAGAPAGPANDDARPVDRTLADGDTIGLGASTVRVLPLRGHAADGIALEIDSGTRTPVLFVGDALGASGPPRITRDRSAAMQFTMDLERALRHQPDAALVWARTGAPVAVADLRTRTTAWRRGFGLPASTRESPVWFTPRGTMLRLRRLSADAESPDHRYIMFMMGATVQAILDPDDPFAFAPVFGQYAAIAALLGLERGAAPLPPVRALHLGAGAFAVPRTLEAARPGSTHIVVDHEPVIADFVSEHLPLAEGTDLRVLAGDARAIIDRLLDARADAGSGDATGTALFDVVVVDVFDGLTVPASISSPEALARIRALLTPGGRALVNVPIDPGDASARRCVDAVRVTFEHVVVAAPSDIVDGSVAGNLLVLGSDAPIAEADIERRLRGDEVPHTVLAGEQLMTWLSSTVEQSR